MSIITLMTDFGHQDSYGGVMKGVIAQINPNALIIDLTHTVPPQDIATASFHLLNSYRYFPKGTVHVVVVDPGVGTERRGVAVEFEDGYLVAPDNGVLSPVLAQTTQHSIVKLTNWQYWYTPNPSVTFHGRDIFAPVAAHLAQGVPLIALGETVSADSLTRLAMPVCQPTAHGFQGVIQYIDGFGNLITNIQGGELSTRNWVISLHQHQIDRAATYGELPVGAALSLVGSQGWVEIAINCGSAAAVFKARVGDRVTLSFRHGSDREGL